MFENSVQKEQGMQILAVWSTIYGLRVGKIRELTSYWDACLVLFSCHCAVSLW